jgi:hypothetical protein
MGCQVLDQQKNCNFMESSGVYVELWSPHGVYGGV